MIFPTTAEDLRQDTELSPILTSSELLRRTGFYIKLRFVLFTGFIPFLPILLLALFFIHRFSQQGLNRTLWLLLAGIFLLSFFVSALVMLPIIRPIRRATRNITQTQEEVARLARNAHGIAGDHRLGTMLLSGAIHRLNLRRQSIARESLFIGKTCEALLVRVQWLYQHNYPEDLQGQRAVLDLLQGLKQIRDVASDTTTMVSEDQTFDQLPKAMISAQEISAQFDDAEQRLQQGALQLAQSAQSLI